MKKYHFRKKQTYYNSPSCDVCSIDHDTYDILPKGANADLMSSVVISGLKSPTNTWKWSENKGFTNQIFNCYLVI